MKGNRMFQNIIESLKKKLSTPKGELITSPDLGVPVADTTAGPVVEEDPGSTYKVPLTTIVEISAHNNAERLEVARVYGFQVIVGKGQYKVGDQVIYVPIDSLLPIWLEEKLFPEGSKIKLHNHRVRQIKIRGLASQGMLINPGDVSSKVNPSYLKLEQDLKAILAITKYEPPQPGFAQTPGLGRNRNKKHEHPLFHKYNGLDNIKWFPDLFKEGEEVVIQEKLHGTNARASKLPFIANTFTKKLKKFFRLAPKVEKCYGSNNVDISAATNFTGFYGEDIYGKCFNAIDVFNKIMVGEIFYGEIVGPGIQKNYTYGLKEHTFVVFDAKVLQSDGKFKWLAPDEVEELCSQRGFEYVPVLYKGPYNRELTYGLTKGPSQFDPKTKVREGAVIKAAKDYDISGNKKALKWVSEDYLADDKNTDFH
jgi:RNA ligase (TIGR02306 family)